MVSPVSSIHHLLPHWKRNDRSRITRPLYFQDQHHPTTLDTAVAAGVLHFRNVEQSRKANSKICSWFACTCDAFIVEIPYSMQAGTLYVRSPLHLLVVGCRGQWLEQIRQRIPVRLMQFGLFYIVLAQVIASVRPSGVATFCFVVVYICSWL